MWTNVNTSCNRRLCIQSVGQHSDLWVFKECIVLGTRLLRFASKGSALSFGKTLNLSQLPGCCLVADLVIWPLCEEAQLKRQIHPEVSGSAPVHVNREHECLIPKQTARAKCKVYAQQRGSSVHINPQIRQEFKKTRKQIRTHSKKKECTHTTHSVHSLGFLRVLKDRGGDFRVSNDWNKIRKLKFPAGRQIFQSSWGCLESVYASFCSSWTLNLRFSFWRPDQNRQAICHGLGRLALTERRGWVCVCVCADEVMCWVLTMHTDLHRCKTCFYQQLFEAKPS